MTFAPARLGATEVALTTRGRDSDLLVTLISCSLAGPELCLRAGCLYTPCFSSCRICFLPEPARLRVCYPREATRLTPPQRRSCAAHLRLYLALPLYWPWPTRIYRACCAPSPAWMRLLSASTPRRCAGVSFMPDNPSNTCCASRYLPSPTKSQARLIIACALASASASDCAVVCWPWVVGCCCVPGCAGCSFLPQPDAITSNAPAAIVVINDIAFISILLVYSSGLRSAGTVDFAFCNIWLRPPVNAGCCTRIQLNLTDRIDLPERSKHRCAV